MFILINRKKIIKTEILLVVAPLEKIKLIYVEIKSKNHMAPPVVEHKHVSYII